MTDCQAPQIDIRLIIGVKISNLPLNGDKYEMFFSNKRNSIWIIWVAHQSIGVLHLKISTSLYDMKSHLQLTLKESALQYENTRIHLPQCYGIYKHLST